MYGYSISQKGILTNNYYSKINYCEEPELQGTYVMIKRTVKEIRISQDFQGSFGLYIYENKTSQYFALSNSFALLEEYLCGKENITFNKKFADELILSTYCASSLHETLINEIIKLPSNVALIINIKKKKLKIDYLDYLENTIPLDSEEGLKIIDNWIDKWGYIYRSLQKQTNNFATDLSGGFDTRVLFSILLSSGLDINRTIINTFKDKWKYHEEDFEIATNISSKLGFSLNKFQFDDNCTIFNMEDALNCSIYSKLGFSKSSGFYNRFYTKPRFQFSGCGGEVIRGYPGYPINQYTKYLSLRSKEITGHSYEFYDSSNTILNRSLDLLMKNKSYKNDYEITADFYSKGCMRNHCSKMSVYNFLFNIYTFFPLLDSDIKKIKYDMNDDSKDLIVYIYIRFGYELINFPFQGNRTINASSIKKALNLAKRLPPYTIKSDYNKHFYIDLERKSPNIGCEEKNNIYSYLNQLYKSNKFIHSFSKIYDNDIYQIANEYMRRIKVENNGYSFLAISKVINDLNKIYL